MDKYSSTTTLGDSARCRTVFTASGSSFTTDLDSSQGGLGENPVPAAMLAAAAASCMLSMIAFKGKQKGFETKGICISAGVEHDANGISALLFAIHVPMPQTEETKRLLESCVKACPVGKAISENVEKRFTWHWTTWMD